MVVEDGLEGDTGIDKATTSKGNAEAEENPAGINGNQLQDSQRSKEDDHQETKTVPFLKLFSFADSTDIALMIVGTIGAIANGLGTPLMTVLFGKLVNSFGNNQNNVQEIVDVVSKIALEFVYLALGIGCAAYLQVTCWMVTGERQASRIRGLYLKAILRQDVTFFDKETNTGEIVGRMSGDTVSIQDAMGEKVGKFLQLTSTFIGGFIVSFIRGWLLTIILCSAIPLLAAASGAVAIGISKTASQGQEASAEAANVVEQTIGAIRTVASFTGEKQAIASFGRCLVHSYKAGVREGFTAGAGFGIILLVVFCSYALAVYSGAKLIIEKGYKGGDVMNVVTAVLTSSM